MQKKELRRNILIGCLVALLFFGWWLRGFLYNWKFRLFSRKHWSYIAHEFEIGWQPSSTSDWIFLITLLLAIPTFLYLWYLCSKIRWHRLLKAIWKGILWIFKKVRKFFTKLKRGIFGKGKTKKSVPLAPPVPAALPQTNKTSVARPKPVAHSMGGVAGVFQNVSAQSETKPTFTPQANSVPFQAPVSDKVGVEPWNVPDTDFANQPLENIELPQREPVVEDIPMLFTEAGYHLIPDVTVAGMHLDYVAICADKLYLILFDREKGDWLAEEEPFNGEAPLWFSEVDHRVSPVYELRKAAEALQKKVALHLPNLPVKAFMIEEKGTIINAEEMLRVWKELDVIVSRTDIGGLEDLPTTTDVIGSVTPASASDIEKLTQLVKGEKNG